MVFGTWFYLKVALSPEPFVSSSFLWAASVLDMTVGTGIDLPLISCMRCFFLNLPNVTFLGSVYRLSVATFLPGNSSSKSMEMRSIDISLNLNCHEHSPESSTIVSVSLGAEKPLFAALWAVRESRVFSGTMWILYLLFFSSFFSRPSSESWSSVCFAAPERRL